MTMEEVGYQERPKGDNVLTQTSMISSGRERRAESRTTRQGGVSAGANEGGGGAGGVSRYARRPIRGN